MTGSCTPDRASKHVLQDVAWHLLCIPVTPPACPAFPTGTNAGMSTITLCSAPAVHGSVCAYVAHACCRPASYCSLLAGPYGPSLVISDVPTLNWCTTSHRAGSTQLAVLHPRKLSVYSVVAQGTSYLQLNKQYEHNFEHTAANMTFGGFGGLQGVSQSRSSWVYAGKRAFGLGILDSGAFWHLKQTPSLPARQYSPAQWTNQSESIYMHQTRQTVSVSGIVQSEPADRFLFLINAGLDYFCVQSYDGQLSFFECEVAVFSRFLPSFLIPGPLCYCAQSDSFITCSAAMELECYKYKVLATATGEKTSGDRGIHTFGEDM